MSESVKASVIPFVIGDDAEAGENGNPAARLHLAEAVRMAEAIVFASAEPVTEKQLSQRLPDGVDVPAAMAELRKIYERRGINLVRVGDAWAFRTAGDLAFLMSRDSVQQKKLSRAALEVLAIIAYHQPVTRAEIEEIRGVETSKGTLDPPQDARPARHLRHDGKIPRPFRAGGNPRPAGHRGTEGRRPAVDAHAVQFLHSPAARRSRRNDRGRGPVDRYRRRGTRASDAESHRRVKSLFHVSLNHAGHMRQNGLPFGVVLFETGRENA